MLADCVWLSGHPKGRIWDHLLRCLEDKRNYLSQMRQIFLANPKGGCGKTMLSVNLAAHYANQGLSVGICDHDPQRSSLDWNAIRPEGLSKIEGIEYFTHQMMPNRFDVMIHDARAGRGAAELGNLIEGHHLLIPVLPSSTDIRACLRHLMGLHRDGVFERNPGKVGLVANRVNVKTNYFKVLMTFLNEVNLPVVGYLRDTQNYVRSSNAGLSIFDLPPSASRVDRQQWEPIIDWLKSSHSATTKSMQQTINELLGITAP